MWILDILWCVFAIALIALFVMVAAVIGGILYRIYANKIVPWLNKTFGEGMY